MRLTWIALWTGLLPLVGIHGAYLLAAFHEHVPWCLPHLTGCTSISRAGRNVPPIFIMRATLIPGSTFMVMYWWLVPHWLRALGDDPARAHGELVRIMIVPLGVIAASCLTVYVTILGEAGETYALWRHLGVIVFFALTFLCQLLVVSRLLPLYQAGEIPQLKLLPVMLAGLVGWQFILGLSNIAVSIIPDIDDSWEDVIEWQFAVALSVFFLVSWIAARRSTTNHADPW